MITIHHLENSRSQRVLWLLEELGVEYQVKLYRRVGRLRLAPPELKAVQPLGKSPVVSDGDLVLAETGAIVEYLVGKYGNGRLMPPAGTPAHQQVIYWLHYAEGSAMPPLLLKLMFSRMPANAPFFLRPLVRQIAAKGLADFIDPQLALHVGWWETSLAATGWFAGPDMTAADVMMSFPVEAAAARAGLRDRPNIDAFLARIHARPAYARALERGGPYELMR